MNNAKGGVGAEKTPTGRFTPPKGYGGFIPVIEEVAEGEWTLGVAPAPPQSAPAASGGVAAVAAPSQHPKPHAREIGAPGEAGRRALDEIPLRPAATPLQGDIRRDIGSRELSSPSLDRRVVAPSMASVAPRHRSTFLWLLVILLALGLAGETWYGAAVMREHNIQLSLMPGVQQAVSALGAAGVKLRALIGPSAHGSADQAVEQKVAAGSEDIPPQTHPGAIPAGPPPAAQTGQNSISAPIVPARSSPQSHPGLQASSPQLRTAQRQAARHRSRPAQSAASTRTASLHPSVVDRGSTEARRPARQFDRPRVDFEVARNSSREIVPGISLRVTATNVREQRYDGYLWLMSDGSALWLSNVAVQHPIVFYPRRGGQADQMVVTRITPDSVVGYLLQPVNGAAIQGENSSPGWRSSGLDAEFTPAGKKNR